jgi:hypothetical protein
MRGCKSFFGTNGLDIFGGRVGEGCVVKWGVGWEKEQEGIFLGY